MKKSLLTLLALVIGLGAAKADITEDWTSVDWGAPTSSSAEPETKTSSSTDIAYTFMGSYIGGKSPSQYLFIAGKTKAGAYISFSLPIECSEIVLTTTSGCSVSAQSQINVYANDEKIESAFAVNKTSTDFKITIPAAYRAKGTVYKIESNSTRYNQQFSKLTFIEATSTPSLSIAEDALSFATTLHGTQQLTIKGSAENIAENIEISVDNSNFTLASTSVSAAELAAGVTVTYTGNTPGEQTANLTFTAGALSQTISLKGFTASAEGTEANPLSVADVVAMQNSNAGPYYVTGIIANGGAANAISGVLQLGNAAVSNIVLTDAEDNKIGVELPSGETRTTLNIIDNPSNVGQNIVVKGSLVAYFGAPGVKSTEYVSGLTNSKAEAEYAFSKASVTVAFGSTFTAPEFTSAEGAPAPEYSSSNTAVATVDAATGAVTIVGIGTTVISATCNISDNFYAGKASYNLSVAQPVNSIAATKEITDENLLLYINYPLTVAFKNNNNNFVTDGTDFIQIYGKNQPAYNVGDVIPAGWIGNYMLYSDVTPEIYNPAEMQEATEAKEFTPAKVSEISAADVNKVVTLTKVVFDAATPAADAANNDKNFTGKIGETEISFRNNYSIESVEAGTYNVTGVVTIYQGAVQFYVTAFEAFELAEAGLSFPEAEYAVKLGEDFTQPVLTKATTAAVTYTSSDEAVATVDANGAVTLVGEGTTTITATAAENEDFKAGEASYILTVTKPAAPVVSEVVEDWADRKPLIDSNISDQTKTPATTDSKEYYGTSATTGITYKFVKMNKVIPSGNNVPSYLGCTSRSANTAYTTFTLPFDCSEIHLITASTNTGTQINFYANDQLLEETFDVSGKETEYKIVITDPQYRKAGTTYKIVNAKTTGPQFAKFIYIGESQSAEPSMSVSVSELSFAAPLNVAQSQTIKGSLENSTDDITLSVDNDAFTVPATITAAELAAGFEVSFTGASAGEHKATLTLSVGDLSETVALEGFAAAHEGTLTDPLTPSDVVALNNRNEGPYYVTGTIYEKTGATVSNGKLNFAATPANNNIVLSDAAGAMIAVDLVNGATEGTQEKLNLVNCPANVGQTVVIYGTLKAFFGVPGVTNTDYISGLTTVGLSEIEADANANVEYFNLQGIRVDNPTPGIYIRRQGNKVTKVLVK